MCTEMLDIKRSEVIFVRKITQSEYSNIFKVVVRGKECALKVYRHIKPSDVSNPLIEHDIFVCESTAYRRLKESGLCDKGYVPNFYGTIQQIQPKFWKPHLDMFLEHDLLPNAVLLEYVSDMQMIDLSTFSTERMQKLFHILREIHNAKVLHYDPYPRNMMVVPGKPDRVLWIDFDRAQTFPKPLTQRQRGWFAEEVEFIEIFAKALAKDHKEERPNESCCYYFEGMSPDHAN